MPLPWNDIHTRGQATLAIWNQFNAAFAVGEVTAASHALDINALPTLAQSVETAEGTLDAARDDRDAALALIKDLGVRLPRVAEGMLPVDDPLHDDIEALRGGVVRNSMDAALDRGRKTLTLWTNVNTRRAALAQAALTIAKPGALSYTVVDLSTALTGEPVKEQAVEDRRADVSEARSALRIAAAKVDRNNKRWYDAWAGNYPPGTPEGDALSQIDTGSAGGPVEPPPGAPEQATLTTGMVNAPAVSLAAAAVGAETFDYQRREEGSSGWSAVAVEGPAAVVDLPGSGTWEYRARGVNAVGAGSWSAVAQVTVAG